MIGLDPVPYNHALRLIINSKNVNFQALIDKNVREVTIQPILVEEKPNF